MAVTSPDNIYSPDQSTLYNIPTATRQMADSIQGAITRLRNAFNPAVADTGWVNFPTGNLASGFTTGSTPGIMQYRIKAGIIYWRGGVVGTIPQDNYTTVATLPSNLRPAGGINHRFACASSGGYYAVAELLTNGQINVNHRTGTNRAWVAFHFSYPLGT